MSRLKLFATYLTMIFFGSMLFISCQSNKPSEDDKMYYKEIEDQRTEKYSELIDSTKSRFNKEEREHFVEKAPQYYVPNVAYKVIATFLIDTSTAVFEMSTTTDRKPNYRIYGYLNFAVKDTLLELTAYQNYDYRNDPEHGKYLFIPFQDNTNEFGSYGGGRYIDILKTEESMLTLDFNTAYNPYCAYADRWSCPLVPTENYLNVAIFAGEKAYK